MRPTSVFVGTTLEWHLYTYNSYGVLENAAVSVSVYKSGVVTADVVSVSTLATGKKFCAVSLSGAQAGDIYTIEETVTNSLGTYVWSWELVVYSQSVSVTVYPLETIYTRRIVGSTVDLYQGETISVGPISVFDESGSGVDLTSFGALEIVITDTRKTLLATIDDGDITISGASDNQWTFDVPAAVTLTTGDKNIYLRAVTNSQVLSRVTAKVKAVT